MKRLQVGKLYKPSDLYRSSDIAFVIYSFPLMESRYSSGTIAYDETFLVLEDKISFCDEDCTPTYTPVRILDSAGNIGYIYLASWDRNQLVLI
jgi:hypothetical protein